MRNKKRNKRDRKAQAWGIDLVIATVIFAVTVFAFYFYALNYSDDSEEAEALVYDGDLIADDILSEGHPEDWNAGNVVKIGILSKGKINGTKLERFYNLADTGYEKTKELFNTKYDYYFLLDEDMSISSGEIRGIGKPGVEPSSISSENLIKITRLTIYKDNPATAYVYIWS